VCDLIFVRQIVKYYCQLISVGEKFHFYDNDVDEQN